MTPAGIRKLYVLLLFCSPFLGMGQVVDELTLPTGQLTGVGGDSSDVFAQSFLADVKIIRKLGTWLRQDSATGAVSMALFPADTAGLPDLNNPLYRSAAIIPPDSGLTAIVDSGLVIPVIQGNKYFLAVEATAAGSGWSNVGTSASFTDTNEPLIRSGNAGISWDTLPGMPMAVRVEGEDCNLSFAIFTSNDWLCGQDTVQLNVGSALLTAFWSTGDTGLATSVAQAGTVVVTAVDSQYCSATDSTPILQATPPDAMLDTTIAFCEGRTASLVPSQGWDSYLWSTGETSSFISSDTSGLFWVEVTSAENCTDRDTAYLTMIPTPSPSLGNDSSLCQGEFLILDAGGQYTNYLWNGGQTTRTITVNSTSTWWVQVIDSFSCQGNSDTVTVTVNPLPATPVITQLEDQLFSSVEFGYQWNFEGQPIPGANAIVYEPQLNGLYSVTVFNQFGCSATSAAVEVLTQVTPDFVPEGFSPNGDGINDFFRVGQIEFYPDNELVVYNRWGKEVYRKRGYDNDWYGTGPGGIILPSGDYYFILDLGDGSEPIRGALRLQR